MRPCLRLFHSIATISHSHTFFHDSSTLSQPLTTHSFTHPHHSLFHSPTPMFKCLVSSMPSHSFIIHFLIYSINRSSFFSLTQITHSSILSLLQSLAYQFSHRLTPPSFIHMLRARLGRFHNSDIRYRMWVRSPHSRQFCVLWSSHRLGLALKSTSLHSLPSALTLHWWLEQNK